jgi:hypothetical protein
LERHIQLWIVEMFRPFEALMHLAIVRLMALWLLVAVLPAFGGTINLTSGSIDYANVLAGDGPVHFVGDRGFTFDGFAFLSSLGAADCAFPCDAGEKISLSASASSNDLPGDATLDSVSHALIGDPNTPEQMSFDITGEARLPEFGASSTTTLVVPVNFTGTFVHRQSSVPPFNETSETLVAGAIATVTLTEGADPSGQPAWFVSHLAYDIVALQPVAIQIRPRRITARRRATVSVKILSSDAFDAATIDTKTLRFGETGLEQSLRSCAKKARDRNRDGRPDLLCSFGVAEADLHHGDTTAVLNGQTMDGASFQGIGRLNVR